MLLNNRQFGLGALPVLGDFETRSISAENPDGRRAGGALAEPQGPRDPARELGKSWKVRPCITLEPESLTTLADITGQGMIQHIWITVDPKAYRDCVLRMFWDGEETPSIEVPLGDFFACGHGLRTNITSLAVTVNPSGGFNSYWPMPFYKSARITVENQRDEAIDGFFYQITYALGQLPADLGTFHAQWRISMTQRDYPEHVILDGLKGNGQYVGTYLAWVQMSDGWWGEGEIKFYMDGDTEYPTICGTGTEDYFCGAWGFDDTFTGPYTGYPLWQKEGERVPKHGRYRWHIMDPIRFHQDLKVSMEALGWWPGGKFQPLTDEIASVGYWYQQEPHAAFPALPSRNERIPR
jgi:hypothetical protein